MSIVISLQSFVDAFCLTICQKCRDENSSGDCNYNDNYIALIISIFPYILRFAQCVNRYYYTGTRVFLLNMVKHIIGILFCFFYWFYLNGKYH